MSTRARYLALGVVVLAVIGGAVWLLLGSSDEEKVAKPVAGKHTVVKPTRLAGKRKSTTPVRPPQVSMDDDPVGDLRLEGQVVDKDGNGVGGAVVTINSAPGRSATSEGDGSFHFEKLVGRTYSLWARHRSGVGGPVTTQLSEKSAPVRISLLPGTSVEVTVVDGDGKAVTNASVQLRSHDVLSETTNTEGVALFRGVGSGFKVVAAAADGFAPARQAVQIPAGADQAATIRSQIVLRKGARVSGRVIDEAGKPIAGARVLAVDASAIYPLVNLQDAVATDKKGLFAIARLSAGTYRLRASKDGYATSSLAQPTSVDGTTPTEALEIVLRTGGELRGKVVDQRGTAVPWAQVRVGNLSGQGGGDAGLRQITADKGGAFVLRGLPRAKLTAMAISEDAASLLIDVDLSTQPRIDDLEIRLSVAGEISGRVVDQQGEPIAEAQVTAYPDMWGGGPMSQFRLRGPATQLTGGDGIFRLRALPDGTYRLRASRGAVTGQDYARPGIQAATGDKNVTIVIQQEGAIKGTLVFADGSTPGVFSVAVGYPPGVPVADEQGRFEIPGVAAGKYDVTFRGPEFGERLVREVEVKPGETTDLRSITVKKGRNVIGRVIDASGSPVAGATVVCAKQLIGDGKNATINLGTGTDEQLGLRRTTTDSDGGFRISGIGDKEMMLIADHAEHGRSMPQVIPAARLQIRSYELSLRGFGSARGTITAGGKASVATVVFTPQGANNQSVVVTTGADGTYVVEKLPEGSHRLTAMLGQQAGSASTAGREVTIRVGETLTADVEIPVGNIDVSVTVQPEANAQIDAAQVFLIRGRVRATNGKELQEAFLAAGNSGGAKMAFAAKNAAAKFTKVTPAAYSICVVAITGNMNDPTCGKRIQEKALELRVSCTDHRVAQSPIAQAFTVRSLGMHPAVCTEP